MILDYLAQQVNYSTLLSLLRIRPMGTSRRNIVYLARLGLDVTYREANLSLLANHLEHGNPVIVFVDTEQLSYWHRATGHAMVVVGINPTAVAVHDPALPSGPREVPIDEFELAWIEGDYTCAVIKIAS